MDYINSNLQKGFSNPSSLHLIYLACQSQSLLGITSTIEYASMFSQPTHGFYVPLFTIFYSSLASLPFYSNLTTFFSSSSALSSPLSNGFYFFLLIFLLHLFSLCFFVQIIFLFFSSFPSLLLPIDFSSFFLEASPLNYLSNIVLFSFS